MVTTTVTLKNLEGHSPLPDVFKCNPSYICAAFYTISTDSVLAWFLCISRASCSFSFYEPVRQYILYNIIGLIAYLSGRKTHCFGDIQRPLDLQRQQTGQFTAA